MTHHEALELLAAAGYDRGFAIAGDVLVLWEHDEDPPTPFTRPE